MKIKLGKIRFGAVWESWKQRLARLLSDGRWGWTRLKVRWRLVVGILSFLLFVMIGWGIGRRFNFPVAAPPLRMQETAGPEAAEAADLSAVIRELQQDLATLRQRIEEKKTPQADGAEEAKDFSPLQWIPPVAGKVVRGNGWEKKGDEWRYHSGVDLSVPPGTPVLAAAAGKVGTIKTDSALGTVVTLDHSGQWRSLYGHLTKVQVTVGQEVTPGMVLGYSSPVTCGPEAGIHFNLYQQENPVNPLAVIDFPKE